jgi:hypothetical protein
MSISDLVPMLESQASGSRKRFLVVLASVIGVLSVPMFCTRFLNDMDYYALVSDKLLRGAVLYRDALDTKPPLVFVHYATVFRLFGRDNLAAVKAVTMAWLALSALLLGRIQTELLPGRGRDGSAALLFVLASFSGFGEDFLSSNTEILANLFVLAGVWCMVREEFGDRWQRLVLGGAAIGMAFLYRYQSGSVIAAYAAIFVMVREPISRTVRRLFLVASGAAIPISIVVAYFVRADALSDLRLFLTYESFYLRPFDIDWQQVLARCTILVVGLAPWLAMSVWQAAVIIRQRRVDRRSIFLLFFLIFSVVPFFAGRHFFPHYMVQAIPALVLLTVARLSELDAASQAESSAHRAAAYARAAIATSVIAFTIANAVYYVTRPAEAQTPALARFITGHTRPHEAVFIWNAGSHVLFDADRSYATRFLSNEFLTGRLYGSIHRRPSATAQSTRAAAIPELWPVLMGDLEREAPRVILDDPPERSGFSLDRYPMLRTFVQENYDTPRVIDGVAVYVRRDAGTAP